MDWQEVLIIGGGDSVDGELDRHFMGCRFGQPYDELEVYSVDAPAALQREDSLALRAGRPLGFGAVVAGKGGYVSCDDDQSCNQELDSSQVLRSQGFHVFLFLLWSDLFLVLSSSPFPAIMRPVHRVWGRSLTAARSPGGEIKGAACYSVLLGPGQSPPRRMLQRCFLPC